MPITAIAISLLVLSRTALADTCYDRSVTLPIIRCSLVRNEIDVVMGRWTAPGTATTVTTAYLMARA